MEIPTIPWKWDNNVNGSSNRHLLKVGSSIPPGKDLKKNEQTMRVLNVHPTPTSKQVISPTSKRFTFPFIKIRFALRIEKPLNE